MTLAADEFIRRFLLHVLPKGFVKIRYFGFLNHRQKKDMNPSALPVSKTPYLSLAFRQKKRI